jgi:hypothetical protein
MFNSIDIFFCRTLALRAANPHPARRSLCASFYPSSIEIRDYTNYRQGPPEHWFFWPISRKTTLDAAVLLSCSTLISNETALH